MAITLVGTLQNNATATSGSGGGDVNISVSGLTILEDDVLVVTAGYERTADLTFTVAGNNSGAGTIVADLYSNDTADTNTVVALLVQGATVDTTITVDGGGDAENNITSYIVRQYRGVDTSTPQDVTATTATGVNTDAANPPSITPTTAGAKIILCYGAGIFASAGAGNNSAWGVPANVNNFVQQGYIQNSVSPRVGMADYDWSSGAFDADAVTAGSSNVGAGSWTAVALALRPAVTITTHNAEAALNANATISADLQTTTLSATATLNSTASLSADLQLVTIVPIVHYSKAQTGANQYSVGIPVKKDAISKATRNGLLRVTGTGGTEKIADIQFDSSTGESTATTNNNWDAFDVYDLGTEYFVWGTFTTNTDNTALKVEFSPSAGKNFVLDSVTSGSMDVREPVVTLGDKYALGREIFSAIFAEYAIQLQTLDEMISARDSEMSVVIDPINSVIIRADDTGVILDNELPKNVSIKASIGTSNITTGGTWSRTVTTGVTCTIGASTGVLNITGLTLTEVFVPITFVYNGITRTANVHIVRQDEPPSNEGGDGGTGTGGTVVNTTSLNPTSGTTYSETAVSNTLTAKAGSAGKVQCTAPISFKRTPGTAAGFTGVYGKWQWRVVSGTWADIATEVADTTDAETDFDPEFGSYFNYAGGATVTQTKTGLTSGVNYEFRFQWRRVDVSGNAENVYKDSGTLTADGTVS